MLSCLDSAASSQSEEVALAAVTSQLRAPAPQQGCHLLKRRRLDSQESLGTVAVGNLRNSSGGGPDPAAPRLGPAALTSTLNTAARATCLGLSCGEQLGDVDAEECSSLDTEEGFVVYQSPLSMGGEDGGGDAGGAAAMPALAEQLPLRLAGDPDLVEMLSVLADTEAELQPSAAYLEQHGPAVLPEVFLDATMRRTAASWLVEVATEFGLHQETLFLGTVLLDRFLSASNGVPRTQLQLVSVACMLIAAKHEEEMHPSVLDFTNIADNCFMPGDLLRMEAIVLDCLSFRVNTPTAHTFLSMYKQALGVQPRTCALASYLAELAMLEYDLLQHCPSHVASAATLLAHLYMGESQGISQLPSVTRYTVQQLRPCMRRLLALQRAAHTARDYTSPYLPVRDKYRGPQWLCCAATTPYYHLPAMGSVEALPAPAGSSADGGEAADKLK